MPLQFNPFTGTFDVTTKGDTGTVAAAGDGTNLLPGIAFANDLNTGIYRPGADQLAISTGGTGRLFVDSSGNVGVSDSSPSTNSIGAGAPTVVLRGSSGAQPTRSAGLCFISQDGTGKTLQYHDSGIFYTQSTTATAQVWFTNNTERLRITSTGRLLVGTGTDSGGALLQVNDNRIRIATAKTPASATDTGVTGEICWDANYVYVCTATNTWKRTALATW